MAAVSSVSSAPMSNILSGLLDVNTFLTGAAGPQDAVVPFLNIVQACTSAPAVMSIHNTKELGRLDGLRRIAPPQSWSRSQAGGNV
jgi:hypothetical protein